MTAFAKYFITLLLAITLVNPVCCCSWGEFFASHTQSHNDGATHSCCGSPIRLSDSDSDSYNGGSPLPKDGQKDCNCMTNKDFAEVEFSDYTFANAFPITFEPAGPVELEIHFEESECYAKLVAYHNPPPPDTPVRILYSTYLL